MRANFAAGRSLYRKNSVTLPAALYDSTEWDTYPLDYCDGLGNPLEEPNSIKVIAKESLSIYPNPVAAGSYIYVEGKQLNHVKEALLQYIDGRVLARYKNPFRKTDSIKLPEQLEPGVYILRIDGQGYKLLVK
ncbi:hypothetical protein D3C72_1991550 [compost metagenome]